MRLFLFILSNIQFTRLLCFGNFSFFHLCSISKMCFLLIWWARRPKWDIEIYTSSCWCLLLFIYFSILSFFDDFAPVSLVSPKILLFPHSSVCYLFSVSFLFLFLTHYVLCSPSQTLARVVCTVMRFSKDQTREILLREERASVRINLFLFVFTIARRHRGSSSVRIYWVASVCESNYFLGLSLNRLRNNCLKTAWNNKKKDGI